MGRRAATGRADRLLGRAVEDATRKAEALASASGAEVGVVRSVTEPAATPHSVAYQPMEGFVGLSSAGDEEMRLQPGGLEIGVSVEVTFDLGEKP